MAEKNIKATEETKAKTKKKTESKAKTEETKKTESKAKAEKTKKTENKAKSEETKTTGSKAKTAGSKKSVSKPKAMSESKKTESSDKAVLDEKEAGEKKPDKAEMDKRLDGLLKIAKKHGNSLSYQQISSAFEGVRLGNEQYDYMLAFLDKHNINMTKDDISVDDIDDDDVVITEEDEADAANIDISIPDGISVEDPVRMYLKEIGKVPLLSADE